ncbi:MAG: hypothetical protein EOO27_39700 [Comamonadaceae bacterium]|nr:MAG: hypothetical protein EOO27_39700 [Comamonadaceae bacterium]
MIPVASADTGVNSVRAIDWSIRVQVAFAGWEGTRYHADLMRDGVWVARIAMKRAAPSRTAAEALLTERCRDWIARNEKRERTGDTAFQILRP